ncbi:hypothetical protein BDN72DRAFT_846251 [Pluteus cervinus]|uniref:Uncharacterized protein n=1 Tax=Pluteus cervinus TaxID=181527 RepID=A0ACD3AGX4_9AGAR|nr:hypothetical protein BDN72DRAFT_846251 [Pluteus cervinus]
MSSESLPPEIWEVIVKFSAFSSLRQAATLARVCRAFKLWAHPILHRVLSYYEESGGWPGKRPEMHYLRENGCHIRSLLWGVGSDLALLASVLEHCPQLENLAVWIYVSGFDLPSIRPALSRLRLRELSINPFALFNHERFTAVEARDPMFSTITHFDVINAHGILEWENLEGLANISNLTHVSLQYSVTQRAKNGILQHCKNLQTLIVMQPMAFDWGLGSSIVELVPPDPPSDDIRLVRPPVRRVREWEMGAVGQPDSWQLADEVIADRRRLLLSSSGEQ